MKKENKKYMFTVNDVKNFKHIPDDLLEVVKNKLETWPDYNEHDKIERGEMDFERMAYLTDICISMRHRGR